MQTIAGQATEFARTWSRPAAAAMEKLLAAKSFEKAFAVGGGTPASRRTVGFVAEATHALTDLCADSMAKQALFQALRDRSPPARGEMC